MTLKPCQCCGSTLGPFLAERQVICSTCGMRGPYETHGLSATSLWNGFASTEVYMAAMIYRKVYNSENATATATTYAEQQLLRVARQPG